MDQSHQPEQSKAGYPPDELLAEVERFDEPVTRPIRSYMLASLIRYRDQRIPTGGFLRAVLENNLKEAVGSADIDSQRELCALVAWCYNEMPAIAWGSSERVQKWLKREEGR